MEYENVNFDQNLLDDDLVLLSDIDSVTSDDNSHQSAITENSSDNND